jgi:hypothetical protein
LRLDGQVCGEPSLSLRFGAGRALRRTLGASSLNNLANLELPATQYPGFSLHLACDLHLEGLSSEGIDAAMMRGNYWMRSQVWLCVMALRQTDDLTKQDLVPATKTAQHL